jgi:hypothetical protein
MREEHVVLFEWVRRAREASLCSRWLGFRRSALAPFYSRPRCSPAHSFSTMQIASSLPSAHQLLVALPRPSQSPSHQPRQQLEHLGLEVLDRLGAQQSHACADLVLKDLTCAHDSFLSVAGLLVWWKGMGTEAGKEAREETVSAERGKERGNGRGSGRESHLSVDHSPTESDSLGAEAKGLEHAAKEEGQSASFGECFCQVNSSSR